MRWLIVQMVSTSSGLPRFRPYAAVSVLVCSLYRKYNLVAPLGLVFVFASMVVARVAIGNEAAQSMHSFGRPIVTAALALVLFVSLLFRPTSDDYLRFVTPPAAWSAVEFRRVSRLITIRWGATMVVVSVSFAAAAFSGGSVARTFCDWLVPLLVCTTAVSLDGRDWRTFCASVSMDTDHNAFGGAEHDLSWAGYHISPLGRGNWVAPIHKLHSGEHDGTRS